MEDDVWTTFIIKVSEITAFFCLILYHYNGRFVYLFTGRIRTDITPASQNGQIYIQLCIFSDPTFVKDIYIYYLYCLLKI